VEINITDIADCRKEFNAKLTFEDLQPHFEKAYVEHRKKIKMDGFRPGKVPMNIIKQRFAEAIEYESIEDIAQIVLNENLKKENIRFAGNGELKDIDYKPKESLTFKIEFEYFPEVELKKYKGLEITRINYVIDESIIDEEIQNIKFKTSTRELDGQVLDDDYLVTLDLQEIDLNDAIIIGQSMKDVKVFVGDPKLEKEMYEAVKNIKEEEEKIVILYHDDETEHRYKLNCKKVEKVIYPEINEEFLKRILGREDVKTEEDFKKHIRKSIEDSYDEISNSQVEDNIINEVVKLNEVQIPPHYTDTILDKEYDEYVEHQEKDHKGEEILSKEDYSKERRPNIIFFSKWFEIKDKIFEVEKLEITEDVKLKMLEKDARKYNVEPANLLKMVEKQKNFYSRVEDYLVMDFLKSNAIIKTEEKIIKAEQEEEKENKIIT
jgi:trigger factor